MGYASEILERAAETRGKSTTETTVYAYVNGVRMEIAAARELSLKLMKQATKDAARAAREKKDPTRAPNWIVGQQFLDKWGDVHTVTRTEPGFVFARTGINGPEVRFKRSLITSCVKHDRAIGHPPTGHGRPTKGGTIGFKASVSHVDRPTYVECDDDKAYRISRVNGVWPHTVQPEFTAPKPVAKEKSVSVTIDVVGLHQHRVSVTVGPVKPVKAEKAVKVAKVKAITKRQARGTYDPSI
jgi:hypothetical protein